MSLNTGVILSCSNTLVSPLITRVIGQTSRCVVHIEVDLKFDCVQRRWRCVQQTVNTDL